MAILIPHNIEQDKTWDVFCDITLSLLTSMFTYFAAIITFTMHLSASYLLLNSLFSGPNSCVADHGTVNVFPALPPLILLTQQFPQSQPAVLSQVLHNSLE